MDGAKLLSRENFHIGIIGVIRVAITPKLCPIWLRVEREREGQIQIPFLIIFTITSGHRRAGRWDGFCGTRDMPRFIPIKSLPPHSNGSHHIVNYDIKKIRRLCILKFVVKSSPPGLLNQKSRLISLQAPPANVRPSVQSVVRVLARFVKFVPTSDEQKGDDFEVTRRRRSSRSH